MKKRTALAVFAVAAIAGPCAVFAASQTTPGMTQTYQLAVTFTPRYATPFERAPIVGELDVNVHADGKISGFYRPVSDRSAVPIHGGVSSGRAFLDVGNSARPFHLEGALKAGSPNATFGDSEFVGSAFIGDETYSTVATPCADPAGGRSILCQ